MATYTLLAQDRVPWDALDRFQDRTVFQSRAWLQFIAETQQATPVVIEIRELRDVIGYFTGLIVRRYGVRILGSSFPGWTTPYIGFNLSPGYRRGPLLDSLAEFAFDELGCWHIEISDRQFETGDAEGTRFQVGFLDSYETNLAPTEEQILAAMDNNRRRCLRRSAAAGLIVEVAADEEFVGEYYDQLKEVFSKRRLLPTYGIDRVRALFRIMGPTGRVLFLRARDPADGRCIATGIYPGYNRIAEFWGNASYRSGLRLHPNEALHWYAMRYWKERGAQVFDWGGGGDYKRRYGPVERPIVWLSRSRCSLLPRLRGWARELFNLRQRIRYRLHGG